MIFPLATNNPCQQPHLCRDQILRVKQSDSSSSSALLPPLILVGNKSDLSADRRKVEQPYALSKSKSWSIPYTETSAKTKENVDKVFFDLLRVIRDRKNVNIKGNKNNKNHHHAAAAANAAAASANATQRQESICSKLFGSWLPGCR
jgi:GTPase SAR1 family protein